VKNSKPDDEKKPRPRLKKDTLRGLGFEELSAVHGGHEKHPRPFASRNCLE
jgi:hypothetical protein